VGELQSWYKGKSTPICYWKSHIEWCVRVEKNDFAFSPERHIREILYVLIVVAVTQENMFSTPIKR
jgi:hypothetical protein